MKLFFSFVGAFCHKDKECAGEACCVLEPTVDEEHEICKPKLSEYHQCSPILYRKIWLGDNKPDCGPCKGGLQCVQRGYVELYVTSSRGKSR